MKSGTTSLYTLLKKHPSVFMSQIKEPGYFLNISKDRYKPYYSSTYELIGSSKDTLYRKMIRGYSFQRHFGEASTHYTKYPAFDHEIAAENIYQSNSKVRLIFIIRNPVDRIISQYIHTRNKRQIKMGINEALATDDTYLNFSLYYKQLVPYLERFSISSFHIVKLDDLKTNPNKVIYDICEFLGIDKTPLLEVESAKENKGIYNSIPLDDYHIDFDEHLGMKLKLIEDLGEIENSFGLDLSDWKSDIKTR